MDGYDISYMTLNQFLHTTRLRKEMLPSRHVQGRTAFVNFDIMLCLEERFVNFLILTRFYLLALYRINRSVHK